MERERHDDRQRCALRGFARLDEVPCNRAAGLFGRSRYSAPGWETARRDIDVYSRPHAQRIGKLEKIRTCPRRARSGGAVAYIMIRKKPALGLDPRVDTGFPKKIMLQPSVDVSSRRSEFRPRHARRARTIEHIGTGWTQLQLASDKTGDDAALIGNVLLTKSHDIRRAGCLIFLGLSECGTGSYRQCSNHENELCHIPSPCADHSTHNLCVSSAGEGIFSGHPSRHATKPAACQDRRSIDEKRGNDEAHAMSQHAMSQHAMSRKIAASTARAQGWVILWHDGR